MARGTPSLLALLGLLAVAGYQNKDKIKEMLGGADRCTLYIASSHLFDRVEGRLAFTGREQLRAQRRGRIDSVRVDVPGASWP